MIVAPADRLRELLAGEAAGERLGDAEWLELESLLDSMPPESRRMERDRMQEAAALAQAAFLAQDPSGCRRMPDDLKARLLKMSRARSVSRAPRGGRANLRAGWGWAAAAAMMVVWLATAVLLQSPQPAVDSGAIRAAADRVSFSWRPKVEGYEAVQGQIAWSDALQAGEMRFSGLPANDPSQAQYQLWIVDPDRGGNHPVDGGVFDAPATGEFVVTVQARLPVEKPVAFAVTLEQPGGVVVSDGPLLLVAAAGPRPNQTL